jgi:TonB family protein
MPDAVGGANINAAVPSSANEQPAGSRNSTQSSLNSQSLFRSDPIWKPDPGGQPLFPTAGKPSAGEPVKFAAKVDRLAEKKTAPGRVSAAQPPADRSSSLDGSSSVSSSEAAGKVAADTVIVHQVPASHDDSGSSALETHSDESAPSMPSTSGGEMNRAALNGVLSAKASLPDLKAPVSLGVSGGKLLHRVPPVYPTEARVLRQGGTVVLAATVMEDGKVGSVRVIDGPPVFAQSAVEAVKQWRYRPFELDGKPVKNEIGITLHFKYPSDSSSQ